jgi:Capsule polysaccharide biosynthesis protein
MRSATPSARDLAKAILGAVGLLPVAQRLANVFRVPSEQSGYERRFRQLKRRSAHVLRDRLNDDRVRQRVALVCSPGFPEVEIELGLIKGLQLANFVPVVIIPHEGPYATLLAEHYRLAAVDEIHEWSEFIAKSDGAMAESVVSRCQSMWDLLEFEHAGIRVGRLAVSTALRTTYRGSLDLQVPEDRQLLVDELAHGMAAANAAQKILQRFRPDLALFVDTIYSPIGELFDSCLQNDIEAIQWQQGHKSNALIFKRYNRETWLQHPSCLSPESWQAVCDMEWTEDHRKRLDQELYNSYASGDWYSVAGTQFNKSIVDSTYLRDRLGLDPNKKTAVIFPHILWDATLFWVKCLFRDFEEWFVETVRAACANDQVNWVIKIHPANQRLREGGSLKESAEVVALRKYIGKLPPHIVMIPPESEISTYSLFRMIDYCVTVCGTVGIEAARLGIPVLTGGRGPYDSLGFTVDSNTREEYLEKVRNIQIIPRLSSAQQELAERFAYVNFLMRPWQAKSVTLQYLPNTKKFSYQGQVNIRSTEDWYTADDLKAFAEWVANPNKPVEFLAQLPQACRVSQ